MQIGAIQSLPSIASTTQPVQPASSVANRSATTESPAAASSPATPSVTTAPNPTGSAKVATHAPAPAQSSSSSSAAAEASLAAVYSTTVKGTTYSGSVEETDGEYTVSIANLPGATANGSSIQGAEDNLGTIIDTLV